MDALWESIRGAQARARVNRGFPEEQVQRMVFIAGFHPQVDRNALWQDLHDVPGVQSVFICRTAKAYGVLTLEDVASAEKLVAAGVLRLPDGRTFQTARFTPNRPPVPSAAAPVFTPNRQPVPSAAAPISAAQFWTPAKVDLPGLPGLSWASRGCEEPRTQDPTGAAFSAPPGLSLCQATAEPKKQEDSRQNAKSSLAKFVGKHLERYLEEGDIIYTTHSTPAGFECVVKLPCLAVGVAGFLGDVKLTEKQAEQSAASYALKNLEAMCLESPKVATSPTYSSASETAAGDSASSCSEPPYEEPETLAPPKATQEPVTRRWNRGKFAQQ